ncbi:MAG TPA: VapC toxin family PIN domain ribonuclease, partial [Candidatus Aminicenantes bacterium]|nr:VapC toxin family PIN domain ribonuclease [Candidatus Aminicenantes bacterium]
YVESGSSPQARQVILRDADWASPILWRSEFRNALVNCLRSGVLQKEKLFGIMTAAETMMSGHEYEVASDDVLELSAETGCSAYDAEFVVLARDLRVPLVTTDRELLEKFPGTAVSPETFLGRS